MPPLLTFYIEYWGSELGSSSPYDKGKPFVSWVLSLNSQSSFKKVNIETRCRSVIPGFRMGSRRVGSSSIPGYSANSKLHETLCQNYNNKMVQTNMFFPPRQYHRNWRYNRFFGFLFFFCLCRVKGRETRIEMVKYMTNGNVCTRVSEVSELTSREGCWAGGLWCDR